MPPIEFQLQARDLLRFRQHLSARAVHAARSIRPLHVLLWLALGVGFGHVGFSGARSQTFNYGLIALVCAHFLLRAAFVQWSRSKAFRRWVCGFAGPSQVVVSESGVYAHGRRGSQHFPWSEIVAAEATWSAVYVYVHRWRAVVVPRRAFVDDQASTEFLDTVRALWARHCTGENELLPDAPTPHPAARNLVTNLVQGLRLAVLQNVDLKKFVFGPLPLLHLWLVSILLVSMFDYLTVGPNPELNTWALSGQAGRGLMLLLAGLTVNSWWGNTARTLHFTLMVVAAGVFVGLGNRLLTFWLEHYEDRQWLAVSYFATTFWMGAVVFTIARRAYYAERWPAAYFASTYLVATIGLGLLVPAGPVFYSMPPEQGRHARPIDVEATYYRQPDLIAASVSKLLAERPGTTDLYFLGFAGYADEDVFLHEVSFAQKLLDRRFDTAGRSLLLANHESTLNTLPLANWHNLDLALQGIGSKMNKDDDVLFLFLSSHGSKKHKLSVEFWPLEMNDLSAVELGNLLDRSGIRNRVIVVSACYSGGFIDVLKNDDSLIMTAASRDRTSFGCGDNTEYTYFGEAYFVQALASRSSFVDAFTEAEKTIAQRELREGIKPSHPQIHIGSRMAAKLRSLFPSLPSTPTP